MARSNDQIVGREDADFSVVLEAAAGVDHDRLDESIAGKTREPFPPNHRCCLARRGSLRNSSTLRWFADVPPVKSSKKPRDASNGNVR